MARYIDADALIDKMERGRWHSAPVELIKSMPHAHVVPAPKWISVDERLPEIDKCVLVIVNGDSGKMHFIDAIEIASYYPECGWVIELCPEWTGAEVSFWMPLPEVPRRCANCGKMFIPRSRSDEIYSDNPSPKDPAKTCKQYGNTTGSYEKNTKRSGIKNVPEPL